MSRRSRAAGPIRAAARIDRERRDLADGAQAAVPIAAEGGRAPRLTPRQYVGRGMTRTGRFRDVDPLSTPRWWSGGRFVGVAIWGLAVGGSVVKAWRDAGGPRGCGDAADEGLLPPEAEEPRGTLPGHSAG